MKVSIITVTYNAGDSIGKTLESVFAQRAPDIEIESIVVDGESTDGTASTVRRLFAEVSEVPNLSCRLISEHDKGIYDAMNKGLKSATGEWVNFMNAGDTFSSKSVVTEILRAGGGGLTSSTETRGK